jgi:hypothetical protein
MSFKSAFGNLVRSSSVVILSGIGLLAAYPAAAHHSGAAFDDHQVIELNGKVKEFQWTNPHTWIQLYVQNEKGETVEWSIEAGGPNSLSRRGWRPTTFPAGAEVTMKVHPMRNGQPAGSFVGAKFADGHTIGRWGNGDE